MTWVPIADQLIGISAVEVTRDENDDSTFWIRMVMVNNVRARRAMYYWTSLPLRVIASFQGVKVAHTDVLTFARCVDRVTHDVAANFLVTDEGAGNNGN